MSDEKQKKMGVCLQCGETKPRREFLTWHVMTDDRRDHVCFDCRAPEMTCGQMVTAARMVLIGARQLDMPPEEFMRIARERWCAAEDAVE